MKNLLVNLLILFLFFINSTPTLAFDIAPEVGDIAPNFHLEGINKRFNFNKRE